MHFYAGSEIDPFEAAMRSTIKKHVGRGHIDIRVQLASSSGAAGLYLDRARLEAYVSAYKEAAAQYGISSPPDLNTAFRIPGILSDAARVELSPAFEQPFIALLEQALTTLNEFRSREGAELVDVMLERNRAISAAADQVEAIRGSAATRSTPVCGSDSLNCSRA